MNAFVAAGITGCHEATTAEGVMRRAELGCYAQQRYGSAWLDMPNTIKAVTENPGLDTRFFTLVTDDVTPVTILEQGHLSRVVREAIKQGVPPIQAIQMVTINAAQLLEKSRWIGTISPGRAADILIVSDLVNIKIDQVYTDGVLVAENGKMVVNFQRYEYPEWATHSVHVKPLTTEDLSIPAERAASVRAMRIFPGMVHTAEEFIDLPAINGKLAADTGRDIAKIAIFYRHEARPEVTKTKSLGFVVGTQFKPRTAYASTVSHDSHNMQVIGTDDEAMVLAANELIRVGGGHCVVVDGKVEALMPMPLAGLMSLESVETVAGQLKQIEAAIRKAGSPYDSVEMTISLLGLIVLEELHLSNRGYVALKPGEMPKFVDLLVTK